MASGNFAPNGDVTVYAGEPISVRIMHGDSDVGKRTYVMTAYNPLNREPYVSVSVDVNGTDAELAFTGADTELLFRKSRKNLEIVQALSNGVRTITNGKLNVVARSNAPDPEATTGVTGVVNVITVGEDGRNVIVGSFGEPGQSPWQAAGQTYAQWLDENVSGPIAAAIAAIPEAQPQLQALADILVPSGATATFRDSDNLMLLGDML